MSSCTSVLFALFSFSILGHSEGGQWVVEETTQQETKEEEEEEGEGRVRTVPSDIR